MRVRWALCDKSMTGGWRARARAFWHYVVRGWVTEICAECGRPVGLVWHSPDALWLDLVGGYDGIRCIPCFDDMVDANGGLVYWRPYFAPSVAREDVTVTLTIEEAKAAEDATYGARGNGSMYDSAADKFTEAVTEAEAHNRGGVFPC
jgi:hypothetical protein